MAPANNNARARAKAEAEKEVLLNQSRVEIRAQKIANERKAAENAKKKSTTTRTLNRNTLVKNLVSLKEPALDPLRDAIMSLSDPSFLNKKFNEDVYRGLPLRVKDFIGRSANQVTRAVIIDKIIEAVKISRNKKEKAKNANFNKRLANSLTKLTPSNNSKPEVTSANNIIKQITELKNKLNQKRRNANTNNVAKKEVNRLVASLVKMTKELEKIKTTLENKLSIARTEVQTLQAGSGSSENNSRLKIAEIALKTQQNKVNELEKILKNLQTVNRRWGITNKASGDTNLVAQVNQPSIEEPNTIDPDIIPPNNSNVQVFELEANNSGQMIVKNNNLNKNAKQLQIALQNNLNPQTIFANGIKLLEGIENPNQELENFIGALKTLKNNNSPTIIPNNLTGLNNKSKAQITGQIYKNFLYGKPMPINQISFLETEFYKMLPAKNSKLPQKLLALTANSNVKSPPLKQKRRVGELVKGIVLGLIAIAAGQGFQRGLGAPRLSSQENPQNQSIQEP